MSSGARSTIDGAIARARDEQNWLTIALAEYSAIRAEIVQALQAQHAIVSYGASALAVLTAVAIGTAAGGATKSDGLITFLFLVLNPLLVVVIFMVWGSEVLRMQRAGMYLFVVEKALNARVPGPPPLNWEHAVNPPPPVGTPGSGMRLLRTRRTFPHVDLVQRIAVPAALLAMVAGSIAAGLAMGGLDWLVSLSILSIVAGVAGFGWLESERHLLRNLHADLCLFEQSPQEPFSVDAWVSDLKPWPSVRERFKILREQTRWSSLAAEPVHRR